MKKLIYISFTILILGIIFCGIFNGYLNNKQSEITIRDKYIKRSAKYDIYLVVDEYKNTYKITDLFFKFKFNSTDLYNQLEIGKTYKIKTSGFRIKILSEYPNINRVEKVKE